MFQKKTLIVALLLLSFSFVGCIENNEHTQQTVDLRFVKLTVDDLHQDFQKINESESYITDPYIVEPGKLFEGSKVYKKYEVLFLNNMSVFLKQQIAQLSSPEKSVEFIDTLKSKSSIPGIEDDWNFTDISIETIGDDSVLKQNKTVIDGNLVTIYLLAFRVNDIVHILASGSVPQDNILIYGKIAEQRINDL